MTLDERVSIIYVDVNVTKVGSTRDKEYLLPKEIIFHLEMSEYLTELWSKLL